MVRLQTSQMYVTSHYVNLQNLNCMKQLLLSFFTASLLVSCSTAYKAGQTPDDVYYSPTREIKEEEPKREQNTSSTDDNYLRMKVRRHTRWANIDDYSYWNDTRYDYCSVYNPYIKTNWYPYYFGNTFYNPYATVITYYPTKSIRNTAASNIKAYQFHGYNNNNGTYNVKTGTYSNGNGSSFSGLVKKAFSSSNSSTWDTPTRTFNNTSSSSSSSSTTTSSSAGGNSGGYSSTGSSSSSGRGGRN